LNIEAEINFEDNLCGGLRVKVLCLAATIVFPVIWFDCNTCITSENFAGPEVYLELHRKFISLQMVYL